MRHIQSSEISELAEQYIWQMSSSLLIWNLMPFQCVSFPFTTWNWILCEQLLDFSTSERLEEIIWETVSNWKPSFLTLELSLVCFAVSGSRGIFNFLKKKILIWTLSLREEILCLLHDPFPISVISSGPPASGSKAFCQSVCYPSFSQTWTNFLSVSLLPNHKIPFFFVFSCNWD